MSVTRRSIIPAIAALSALAAWRLLPRDPIAVTAVSPPLDPPSGPLKTFHLGHSLVGRDMPAMLAQLSGHDYASQTGWGTPLGDHWKLPSEIKGYEVINEGVGGLETGGYDAFVLTEMVDIHDAVRYHDSAVQLARWVEYARLYHPNMRIYLYETWPHRSDDPGWLGRIDTDHDAYWREQILRPAAAKAGPIHMIPAGQVMAAYVRSGARAADLLAGTQTGDVDTIHLGDKGNYLVALTHYATLYQRDPAGMPFALKRHDGTAADAPTAAEAAAMQQVVWQVVSAHELTGISQ